MYEVWRVSKKTGTWSRKRTDFATVEEASEFAKDLAEGMAGEQGVTLTIPGDVGVWESSGRLPAVDPLVLWRVSDKGMVRKVAPTPPKGSRKSYRPTPQPVPDDQLGLL